MRLLPLCALVALLALAAPRGRGRATAAPPGALTVSSPWLRASVAPDGTYAVVARDPAWTFGGRMASPLGRLSISSGSDGIGAYRAIVFGPRSGATRDAIRVYATKPVAIFAATYLDPGAARTPFPTFTAYPHTPYHLSYSGRFGVARFDLTGADSPWLFFDGHDRAAILSPASDFMVARTTQRPDGAIAADVDGGIAGLPRGLTHLTMLTLDGGVNRTFETWGQALTALSGKRRPANDADAGLKSLGYWTDHGAAYYYAYDPAFGYTGTLLAVRDQFARLGLPLGYMQLDSWWYPKGSPPSWQNVKAGAYAYVAAPALFPRGLPAFQRQLGLPMIVHGRWITAQSPYRARYAMSGNVPIDPRFWDGLMSFLNGAGVITYEQDWLAGPAVAADNLAAQNAYLGNMARAARGQGLSLQYCTPLPRDYLQSTLYANLYTMRVSDDRFDRTRWTQFLYGSRLAGALGVWPWTDVFMSGERDNLLMATLSAGMVGVGDRLGAIDADNLRRAVRADGEIVKPDAPLVPADATYAADARQSHQPMVAWTYSDHGGMRAAYVFAYRRGGAARATFAPSSLGLQGRVYVYDTNTGHGNAQPAERAVGLATPGDRTAYDIVVPVGPSGIAFLGDSGKFVSLGRQRIARLSDAGVVEATVAFAPSERAATLQGYAPRPPRVMTTQGAHGAVVYSRATGLFHVAVSPGAGGTATVRLALDPATRAPR